MTIHMKKARASPFEKTFERRAERMLALVMRTLVKVDFSDKDVGIFIHNSSAVNIPMGFLKFDDKVWTGKEIAQFAKYIDISSEFACTVTFLDPEPATLTT
jgi:hypothetical protein